MKKITVNNLKKYSIRLLACSIVIIALIGGYIFYKLGVFSTIFKPGKNINSLEKIVLHFKKLPISVQEALINQEVSRIIYTNENQNSLNTEPTSLWIIDSPNQYQCEVNKTGSWINYILIKNINEDKTYIIERGTPEPYIIYKNTLIIPQEYNITGFGSKENICNSLYNQYLFE